MPQPDCRLACCKSPDLCKDAGSCQSTAELAHEYRTFLTGDAMPSLRHVIHMLEDDQPKSFVKAELQALLMRAARTI